MRSVVDTAVEPGQAPGLTVLAVLAPVLGGIGWAVLTFAVLQNYGDDLTAGLTLGLWLSFLVFGASGLALVVGPMVAGIFAQDDRERLLCAAVGAVFTTIGGLVWLRAGSGEVLAAGPRFALLGSTIPLFAPAVLVCGLWVRSGRS